MQRDNIFAYFNTYFIANIEWHLERPDCYTGSGGSGESGYDDQDMWTDAPRRRSRLREACQGHVPRHDSEYG